MGNDPRSGNGWMSFDASATTLVTASAMTWTNLAEHGVWTAEKVALFRRMFRGRTDVYPVRWEGCPATHFAPPANNPD